MADFRRGPQRWVAAGAIVVLAGGGVCRLALSVSARVDR